MAPQLQEIAPLKNDKTFVQAEAKLLEAKSHMVPKPLLSKDSMALKWYLLTAS
jgi:hypothetical protein